jgi:hypothetical protein
LEKASLLAVLLRPDRYVAATADNTKELAAIFQVLPE